MLTLNMFNKKSLVTMLVLMITLMATVAMADILDGEFSNGGGDWAVMADPGFSASFPAAGGNPDAYARLFADLQNMGGRVCISQTFLCGDIDQGTECTIGFDYFLSPIDAAPGTARIIVVIDGIESIVVDHPTTDWEFVSYVVPCGPHTIEICLEVDPQYNMWEACIDNVRAECTGQVPNDVMLWDGIKSLYR
jgi:hypothetical protein